MESQKGILIIITVVLILALAILINTLTGRVVQDEEVIEVGGAFGLTGFSAEWGEAERQGAVLAIEEINSAGGINNKKVELITEDIQSEGTKAVNAVSKLINVDKVDFILGPTWLETYGGASPLADQYDILMMTPSASIDAVQSEKKYNNVFSTWYRSKEEAEKLAEHLSSTDKKRIVLVFGNDPFWQDLASKFKSFSGNLDIEIAKEYKVGSKETDFRTYWLQIKNLDPEVIIFGLNDEITILSFLKQRKEIYPESTLYTTEYFEEFTQKEKYSYLKNNIYYIAPEDVDQDFVEKYERRFGETPVFSASNSYDAIKIILEAIEKTDSTKTEELKEYIMNNEFDTVTFGKTRFDDLGGVSGGNFVIKKA